MSTPDLTAAIERYAAEARTHREHGWELLAKFSLREIAALQAAIAAAIELAAEEHPEAALALRDVDTRQLEDAAVALRLAHEALGEPDDRAEMQRLTPAMLGLRAA